MVRAKEKETRRRFSSHSAPSQLAHTEDHWNKERALTLTTHSDPFFHTLSVSLSKALPWSCHIISPTLSNHRLPSPHFTALLHLFLLFLSCFSLSLSLCFSASFFKFSSFGLEQGHVIQQQQQPFSYPSLSLSFLPPHHSNSNSIHTPSSYLWFSFVGFRWFPSL